MADRRKQISAELWEVLILREPIERIARSLGALGDAVSDCFGKSGLEDSAGIDGEKRNGCPAT